MTYRRLFSLRDPNDRVGACRKFSDRAFCSAPNWIARAAAAVVASSFVLAAASFAQGVPGDLQGFNAERLQRVGAGVKSEMSKGSIPGAVVLVDRNGKIVQFEAYGFLDAGRTKTMAKDSIFRLFSMTKPVTTVAAMMLVERGVLNLDDPVAKYLPELKDLKVEVLAASPSWCLQLGR